ncbi:hypothetical protein ACLESO_06960 [Pyxidicoccus sp. 3LG]
MPYDSERRRLIQLSLLAAASGLMPSGTAVAAAPSPGSGTTVGPGGPGDFDFFLGTWSVKHRRLRQRLANNNDWQEFDGTCRVWSLLGGLANINERVVNRPDGAYRGLGLRAFDPTTKTWADWNLDARHPHRIDVPIIGTFTNGVGTFLSDDTFEGRPIKVRGMFSKITPTSAQWEQAFSPDGGKTWETNWVMRYTRTA